MLAKTIAPSGGSRDTVIAGVGGPNHRGSVDASGNTIAVFIAHMSPMTIPVASSTTTLRDLLPLIAKKHRLRLYTDHYEFIITQDEQERLNLALPVFELDTIIQLNGLKEVELRKKVFADASKVAQGIVHCILYYVAMTGVRA